MRWFARLFLLASLLLPRAPAAGERNVDLALVLLTDVSRSVDGQEYDLIKQGYAAALTDPRVLAAIAGGPQAAIAILYVDDVARGLDARRGEVAGQGGHAVLDA